MSACLGDVSNSHDGRPSFVAIGPFECRRGGRPRSGLKSVFSDLVHAEEQISSSTSGTAGMGRHHWDLLQILRGAAERIHDASVTENDGSRRVTENDDSKKDGCNTFTIESIIDGPSQRNKEAVVQAGSIKQSFHDVIAAIRAAKAALPGVCAECKTAEVGVSQL